MVNRRNQILSALLALQIVLGIVVFWPRSSVSGAASGPLLTDFNAEEVVSLTIQDAEGNQVTLAKDAEGWVLPEAGDYPADGERISSLLEKIADLQTNRQVTQTESSHKRLKVAEGDFLSLVELELAGGQTHKLYVGTSPRTSATHIRADGRPETYLTADLPSYEVNARSSAWIDTLYYTVPQTPTLALSLKNENGDFEFERDEGDRWVMKGLGEDEEFKESTFSSLLSQATSLRMVEPIGQEEEDWFGLDQPQAVVTLKSEEGKVYTLLIGAKDEEKNSYVAKWSESPYYVQVAEYTANSILDKTRDDFIEPPASPTPESDAGSTEAPSGNGN